MMWFSEPMDLVEDPGLRHTTRAPSPRYLDGVVGLLHSSMMGSGRAIIFAAQYNAMQIAVDVRSWRSVFG